MNFDGEKNSAGAPPVPESRLSQGKMEVEMNFDGEKSSAGARPVLDTQLPQGNMEVEMNFYRAPPVPARLPQAARTGPSGIMVYGGVPRGRHLSSSLSSESFRQTVVSETRWRNGTIYPRRPSYPPPRDIVYPLPPPQLRSAGSQASPPVPSSGDVNCVRYSNGGPCQFCFGLNGCRDGYSSHYRHNLQAWLGDRQTKGQGRKRKLGER